MFESIRRRLTSAILQRTEKDNTRRDWIETSVFGAGGEHAE
jgi:hypothetical protein